MSKMLCNDYLFINIYPLGNRACIHNYKRSSMSAAVYQSAFESRTIQIKMWCNNGFLQQGYCLIAKKAKVTARSGKASSHLNRAKK